MKREDYRMGWGGTQIKRMPMYGRRGLSSAIGIHIIPHPPSRLISCLRLSPFRSRFYLSFFPSFEGRSWPYAREEQYCSSRLPGESRDSGLLAFSLDRACIQGVSGVTHCLSPYVEDTLRRRRSRFLLGEDSSRSRSRRHSTSDTRPRSRGRGGHARARFLLSEDSSSTLLYRRRKMTPLVHPVHKRI